MGRMIGPPDSYFYFDDVDDEAEDDYWDMMRLEHQREDQNADY